jgi:Fic family protein
LRSMRPCLTKSRQTHEWIQRHALFSATDAAAALDLSHPAIMKSIRNLQDLAILTEVSGRQRKQVFAYRPLIDILSEGTEISQ